LKRASSTAGFSLVELSLALALTLIVTATIFNLIGHARRRFDAEPETVDLQQRTRVVVDTLQRDLLMASSLMPYRAVGPADPPGTFRDDVVTIVSERSEVDTVRAYYIKRDAASGASQLVRAEGSGVDAPVVDGVASLSFTYFGDPAGSADPADACAATAAAGVLVPIAAPEFSDGPWCAPAAGGELFDADVLRIRRIAVHVRLTSAASGLSFDVAPRNMNEDR
jgi:hypothetical protein